MNPFFQTEPGKENPEIEPLQPFTPETPRPEIVPEPDKNRPEINPKPEIEPLKEPGIEPPKR